MNIYRKYTPLIGLLLAALLVGGCSSDPVAPKETAPTLTEQGAVQQAALVSLGLAQVAPQVISFNPGGSKQSYNYEFPSEYDVEGTVYLDFYADETMAVGTNYDDAGYGLLFTEDGNPLVLSSELGGEVALTFDLMADLDRDEDTATILEGSSGGFVSGDYSASFDIINLVVHDGDDYPESGSMDFHAEGFNMMVMFGVTGNEYEAVIVIADVDAWTVDLRDGSFEEIPE